MVKPNFEEFRDSIQRLGGVAAISPEDQARVEAAATALASLPRVTAPAVSKLVRENPDWISALGLCVRLSQEQLKGILKQRFGTESVRRVSRDHADELVSLLNSEFDLLVELRTQRRRRWSFSDVLLERFASRLRAAGSISRGRGVEDLVEAVVKDLGLPYEMRTRFNGRGGQTGPCDLVIPSGGRDALIVCAIKGFDSTGSKLTAASDEVARMAEIKLAKQFIFAVLDGVGWLRRQSDLRRIYALLADGSIDGLYTISGLGQYRIDLESAARRLGLAK